MVPAFNEEAVIGAVVAAGRDQGLDFYVVDDGSGDGTAAEAGRAGARVIVHDCNRGKGKSLEDGIERAAADGYQAVIFMDADGQHDPAELGKFVRAAEGGAELVLGCRDFGKGMPFLRRATNRFQSWLLSRIAGCRLSDTQSGYRLVRTDLWPKIRPRSGDFAAESEMLVRAARVGARMAEVPIRTIYLEGRDSRIRPIRDTWQFLLLVLRLIFGRKSRRVAGPLGDRGTPGGPGQ